MYLSFFVIIFLPLKSLLHFRLSQAPSVPHPHRCGYQQKALVGCVGFGEIRRGDISVSDGLVCPKPRRTGFLQINNQQPEGSDLKAVTELLDIIFTRGSYDVETTNFEMASSPPFFLGSPPTRASNPLIQDARFGNVNFIPIPATPERAPSSPPSFTSTRAGNNGGSCVPVKFGIKPAAVRIEGFNCCSSISAVA